MLPVSDVPVEVGRTGGMMSVPVGDVTGGGEAVVVRVVVCVTALSVRDGVMVTMTVVTTVEGEGEDITVVDVLVTVVTSAEERTPGLHRVSLNRTSRDDGRVWGREKL